MIDLAGKNVLLTGAAVRLGRSIAQAFAKAGARVVVHYRNSADAANGLVAELQGDGGTAIALQAELTNAAACADLVASAKRALGPIDVLINNAASFLGASIDADADAFETALRISFETNVAAPLRLARACAADLRNGRGCIINICDIAGRVAWPGYLAHGASKAGLEHATRILAAELAPHVRVNAVVPAIAAFPDSMAEEKQQELIDRTLLGRAGTPEQIADTVVFLASHDYMTGAVLPVDAGWSVQR